MQPAFPPDHHFHGRNRRPPAARPEDLSAFADQALDFLTRQCLPAFDPSDPRGAAER
jgi:hypothetical protein